MVGKFIKASSSTNHDQIFSNFSLSFIFKTLTKLLFFKFYKTLKFNMGVNGKS